MYPAPVRLHSWYSETEDEADAEQLDGEVQLPAPAAARPLPDEISVNNLLDDVATWSNDEGDGAPPPPPETEPPEEEPPETEPPEEEPPETEPPEEEPARGLTPETASAAASPDRTSQVRGGGGWIRREDWVGWLD